MIRCNLAKLVQIPPRVHEARQKIYYIYQRILLEQSQNNKKDQSQEEGQLKNNISSPIDSQKNSKALPSQRQ